LPCNSVWREYQVWTDVHGDLGGWAGSILPPFIPVVLRGGALLLEGPGIGAADLR
jgi:hypothetical protein